MKKRMHQMSSAERRKAAPLLAYYSKLDKLPQLGVVVFGGGLDTLRALEDARLEGYYIKSQTAQFATLHR